MTRTTPPLLRPLFFTSPPIIIIYIYMSLYISSAVYDYLLFYSVLLLLYLYALISICLTTSLSIPNLTYRIFTLFNIIHTAFISTLILTYLWVDRKEKEDIQRWIDQSELTHTNKWQHNTGYRTLCILCIVYRRQKKRLVYLLSRSLMVHIGNVKVKLEIFFLELLSWYVSGNINKLNINSVTRGVSL